MRIGIDCDGVLTDMTQFIYEYGEKWFKKKPVNPDGYSMSEIFEVTEREEFEFGLHYFFTYCKKWPPRKDAVKIVEKPGADGHQLYKITARKFITQKTPLGVYSRIVFSRWDKKHNMRFADKFYCSEQNAPDDKLRGCRKYAVDLMIEDTPNVAIFLADNGIKVFLFETRYNRGVSNENIIRVADWEDVYQRIRNLNMNDD